MMKPIKRALRRYKLKRMARKTESYLADSTASKVVRGAGALSALLPVGRAGRTAKAVGTVARVVVVGSLISQLVRDHR